MGYNLPETKVHAVNFKIEPIFIPTTALQKLEQYPNGSGGLGDVWKCSFSAQSEPVAVKSIRVPQSTDEELVAKAGTRIRREAYVWIKLSHDRILPFKGVTEGFGPLPALVSPWMKNGSLNEYIRLKYSELSDHQKLVIIQEVASGLSYLHREGVVHGDLTGTNVLVGGDGHVCLADFGLSMILAQAENTTFNSCHPGNVRWMDPEVLDAQDEQPTESGDVYSYGCVALQVLSGKQPYEKLKSVFSVMSAMAKGQQPFVDMKKDGFDGKLSSGCFKKPANLRLTIHQVTGILGL
ncbi:kinase-like domain-containing protein [Suillus clintonianus]|uniref:kinase-like domain-containing protein n=1 Tax=Suillus clintonianus TaxID=1904413 RepID=UPI001B85B822|nr:kinase-like domain-containing protein [Suillus clintonianus]KAG2134520.1 kinase-like domain-containing protein [Suillus clintonianus]